MAAKRSLYRLNYSPSVFLLKFFSASAGIYFSFNCHPASFFYFYFYLPKNDKFNPFCCSVAALSSDRSYMHLLIFKLKQAMVKVLTDAKLVLFNEILFCSVKVFALNILYFSAENIKTCLKTNRKVGVFVTCLRCVFRVTLYGVFSASKIAPIQS